MGEYDAQLSHKEFHFEMAHAMSFRIPICTVAVQQPPQSSEQNFLENNAQVWPFLLRTDKIVLQRYISCDPNDIYTFNFRFLLQKLNF